MEEEKKQAYSEVVEILKMIEDEKKLEQIPFEVIQLIKANSDPTYKPNISKDIPLENQNLKNETYSILGWIANKYWDENIIEFKKENLKNEENITDNIENIKENTEELRNVSVYNDIEPECLEGKNLPVLASSIMWYEKIKIKVIRLFRLIFKIKSKNEKEGETE